MSNTVHISIDQSSTLNLVIYRARDQRGQVIDLSGVTGNAAFKINYTANVAFTLPVSTNANGELIVVANTTQTNVAAGRYVYDVLLSNGERIVSGLATVNPAVAT